ncbi:hypothetical protein DMUE_1090 [Dictyocoela muelleri]|nr:hypothetical protein DMUE_1090 [Dictyocoela muelleri]
MVIKKSFYSFLAASGSNQRKSNQRKSNQRKFNQRNKDSYNLAKCNERQEQSNGSIREEIDPTAQSHMLKTNIKLFTGMDKKDLDVKLFMLCESRNFAEFSLKEKFMYIV